MPVQFRALLSLPGLVFALAGCLGYPISEKTGETAFRGQPDSGESIIRVNVAHGTQYVFSPEGPRRMIHGRPSSYDYYLEKDGSRRSLHFLRVNNSEENWNAILPVDKDWFAIALNVDPTYFLVVHFNAAGFNNTHEIDVSHSGAVADIYIDKGRKYIVWKQINDGYYRYDLAKEKLTRKNEILTPSDIDHMIKVPGITAGYEEMDFSRALIELHYRYARFSPSVVSTTDSIDMLNSASRDRHVLSRWAVAVNPKTPISLLQKLKNDQSYYVAAEARKRLSAMPDE